MIEAPASKVTVKPSQPTTVSAVNIGVGGNVVIYGVAKMVVAEKPQTDAKSCQVLSSHCSHGIEPALTPFSVCTSVSESLVPPPHKSKLSISNPK